MGMSLAVVSQKGGVGKTTVTEKVVNNSIPGIGELEALHMPGSPDLLCVGEMVEDRGWTFKWPPGFPSRTSSARMVRSSLSRC